MQLSKIAHLKFLLKLRYEPLQLGYIACQYDQIIHVKDCHQQISTQRLIRLAPTKPLHCPRQRQSTWLLVIT